MTYQLPEPALITHGAIDFTPKYWFTGEQLLQAYQAGRLAGLEEAEKLCGEIGTANRAIYKGRSTNPEHKTLAYDTRYDNMADGAWECEEAINKLKESK